MRKKSLCKTVVVASTVLFFSGCAFNRTSDPRSASDVFIDVTAALFGISDTDEIDRDRNQNRKALEKRRKWQCENLNDSELRELGVIK